MQRQRNCTFVKGASGRRSICLRSQVLRRICARPQGRPGRQNEQRRVRRREPFTTHHSRLATRPSTNTQPSKAFNSLQQPGDGFTRRPALSWSCPSSRSTAPVRSLRRAGTTKPRLRQSLLQRLPRLPLFPQRALSEYRQREPEASSPWLRTPPQRGASIRPGSLS
ncbi:MAG: hypothetical protein ACI8W3_001208 [Myxococcota bacterium]|jgi:hypothetical protein